MKRLAVILVTYNREDFVDKCIASMAAAASPDLHLRIVVMDNGSTDSTPDVLARCATTRPPHVAMEVHRTEDNRRVPETLNRGFRLGHAEPSDYMMMMNDDTEFLPGALQLLVAASEANPDGMLMPLHRNYREPEHIDANLMKLIRGVDSLIEDAVMQRPLKQVYPMRTVGSAAMLAQTSVWRDIGEWDEIFWFYGLDDDLCNRALHLGYRNLLVPASHLFHAHGKLGARKEEQNKAGLRERWRKETQSRYWFRVKHSQQPFWLATLGLIGLALRNAAECLVIARWPWGAVQSILILFWFLPRLNHMATIRSQHFDPARKRS